MSSEARFFQNVSDAARFREAIRQFDELNGTDPNREPSGDQGRPRELLQAERLSEWVLRLDPGASEVLRLASRCQHLCRWMIPRDRFPLTRAGYHQWRNELKQFHAEKAGTVLRAVRYDEETVARVQALNLKKNFPADPESRILEDALCLVFLQFQLGELAAKTEDAKVINALQKSWRKMSPAGRNHAVQLTYPDREKALLDRALSD